MRIAFFSAKSYDRESFNQFLSESGHEVSFFEARLELATVSLAEGYPAICSFVNDIVDDKIMQKLSQMGVQLIALRCAGFNQIDLESAKKVGIRVVRVPAYSPEAVAEHAFALILALSRKTHKAFNRVRENNFSLEGLTGITLHGKTMGVIGTGAIGKAFCKIALGFGCKILAHDIAVSEEMEQLGVTYLPIDEVISQSHIISLHCPLTPETRHLINSEKLLLMPDRVMLINTSRGALIDTAAVIEALKSKKIGHLGIDVYEQEEHIFFRDLSEEILQDEHIARLMSFPNVMITGHQAFLTDEALSQIAKTTLANVSSFEKGEPLINGIA